MSKKYLRKNEFRIDYNKTHYGKDGKPHPAYITARYNHMYKANDITHARYSAGGLPTYKIDENPNKFSKDKRQVRITQPFWQNEKQFGTEKLDNFRFSKKARTVIKKYNKKFCK